MSGGPIAVDRPPSVTRIAAAQYPIERLDTFAAYAEKTSRLVADAAAHGSDLIVFPEYGAMEYSGAHPNADLAGSLAIVADAITAMDRLHVDLARRYQIHILAASGPQRAAPTSGATAAAQFHNAARLISPVGNIGRQDKLIMTPFEKDWGIAPGRETRVFDTSLGRIGVAICYDSEFPLLVRAMVEAGAEIILIPSCTEFVSGYHRVRTAALARALENGCVCVQSPTIGDAPWCASVDRNVGAAGIFVPPERGLSETGVIAEGRLNEPGLVYGTVDLAALRRIRLSGEMRNHLDWPLQPGAAPIAPVATVTDLR